MPVVLSGGGGGGGGGSFFAFVLLLFLFGLNFCVPYLHLKCIFILFLS